MDRKLLGIGSETLMPELQPLDWAILAAAAFSMGIAKAGLAGLGLLHVTVFALFFGARDSTGVVLPMLIVGDIGASIVTRQHTNWKLVGRMMPPALIGIVLGWWLMAYLQESWYRPIIGITILLLTALQAIRIWKPRWFTRFPHSAWFAWTLGLLMGFTTMISNAAGPIFGLYLLALSIPKLEFVGTSAVFFLLLNLAKVPFSVGLGLIRVDTLAINLWLSPSVLLGLWFGRWLVHRLPQTVFDSLILVFTTLASIRLLWPSGS